MSKYPRRWPWLVGGGLILACWLHLLHSAEPCAPVGPVEVATSASPSQSPPSNDLPPTRSVVAGLHLDDRAACVRVVDSGGVPVEGAAVTPISPAGVGTCQGDPIGVTDQAGIACISPPDLPLSKSVMIFKRGYLPAVAANLIEGGLGEAVLRPGSRLDIRVQTSDGRPVPGFAVLVGDSVPSEDVASVAPGKQHVLARTIDDVMQVAHIDTTDESGMIRYEGLASGRHFLHCNITQLPFCLATPGEQILVDVPGPEKLIVIEELVGAVVDFTGDPVVVTSVGSVWASPFALVTDHPNLQAIARARRDLQGRVPGDQWFVGCPKADRAKELALHWYSETSGWGSRLVPLQAISAIDMPQHIVVPIAASDVTARVRAQLTTSGTPVMPGGSQICLGWQHDGVPFLIRAKPGEQVRAPVGECYVSPGGTLPSSAFPGRVITLAPGSNDLSIALERWPREYSIDVRLPEGCAPANFGLTLRGNESRMVSISGGMYSFVSFEDSVDVVVNVAGFRPAQRTLRLGGGEIGEGREVFVIRMEYPVTK